MATVNVSYKNAAAYGTPAFEALDEFVDANLLAGAEPQLQPTSRILLGDSLTLAPFSVVGLNAAGRLVMATWNATLASGIQPIGVLLHAATSGAANATVFGEVFLTGCFNADEDSPLVWHASFDTLDKKTTWAGVVGKHHLIFRSRNGTNGS